jgi:hypothetical protein
MSYFKTFGHTCGLKIDEDFENYLNNRPPLHRFLIKWTSIDVKSEITTQYFSSHAAVVNGMKHHLDSHPITIHPFSRFKFIWELVMASMFLTGLIYVPLQYLDYLDNEESHIGNLIIIKTVKLTCIVDIILRFFCGYVDEKKFTVSNNNETKFSLPRRQHDFPSKKKFPFFSILLQRRRSFC